VEETRLEGMKDFIQIIGQHSLLLTQKSVIDNVVHFLNTGKFLHKIHFIFDMQSGTRFVFLFICNTMMKWCKKLVEKNNPKNQCSKKH
ncbi:MAG TPA: hypothetical protein PLZ29_06115, partial [Spirochaetota bacterium]|nr:hypothetical protein [Spirochaetota bacterium]